jgi:hypothetical protein
MTGIANGSVVRFSGRFASILVFVVAVVASFWLSSSAFAAAPAELWQVPEDSLAGSTAGRLDHPRGIATDPSSGHVYVVEQINARVAEFTAWGEFVKAWGWGVATGAPELQTCGPGAAPATDTCLRGIHGDGPGQFSSAETGNRGDARGGIAVNATGDIYVGDLVNHRVQKFDSAGNFLLMFGGGVDKGPGHPGDVCTAAYLDGGDSCAAGVQGSATGQFETTDEGNYIAVTSGGGVFVGDKGRIQKFGSNGAFESEIALDGALANKFVDSLAVDTAGDFYLTALTNIGESGSPTVWKLNPTGESLLAIETKGLATNLALASNGGLYVSVEYEGFGRREVLEFDSSGKPILSEGAGFAKSIGSPSNDTAALITGLATNAVTADGDADIYVSATTATAVSYVKAFGVAPDKWPPPAALPEITSQYATSVDATRAVLGADINPKFWTDTTYYVEYGTGKCSEGGCASQQPSPPGPALGVGAINRPAPTKAVVVSGLQPETTYHYRFVTQSSGGGPVHGVGPDETEGTFVTPSAQATPAKTDCANQGFRAGAAGRLADCRAYEMVSPIDKNNTDITPLINIDSTFVMLDQSASSGEKLTYTTSQGFGDTQGVPYLSQYVASRTANGWQSHGITPAQGLSPLSIGKRIELEFRAFTPDLCASVLQHVTDPPLAPGAVQGFANLYGRENCGEETYWPVTTSEPPNFPATNYRPEPQSLSADGRCVVFYAEDQLTPDAVSVASGNERTNRQLYESCGNELRLISFLPSGKASEANTSVGTDNSPSPVAIRTGTDAQAVSSNGARIYWTAAGDGPGRLYVRVNADADQSPVVGNKCTDEEKACTIAVSQSVTGASAHFWGAAADGSTAIFSIEEQSSGLNQNLYEFELESRKASLIAAKATTVVGVGGEASRVYFISREDLAGANSQGESPSVGSPNLYFYERTDEGKFFNFIGTLSAEDAQSITGIKLTPVNAEPYKKTSRLSPDGRHFAFTTTTPLTGYDNTDKVSGESDNEVFVYDAVKDELNCASCNPTGQRPSGRIVPVEGGLYPENWTASFLPPHMTEQYGSRAISDDGSRVFFNSFEPLLPRDTNGMADVYQWEVPGSGDCSEGGADFSPSNGGCLSLISSGESPSDSEFIDASSSGQDVFFTTASSLVPQDPGLLDIYDAREGGGFAGPAAPTAACEGEACQGPLASPNDPTPASSSFSGAGNFVEKSTSRKHRRKKHKHRSKGHRRAEHKRRAAR